MKKRVCEFERMVWVWRGSDVSGLGVIFGVGVLCRVRSDSVSMIISVVVSVVISVIGVGGISVVV